MTPASAAFLQVVIVIFGLGALAFMVVMPHFEGRNARATVFEVYFKDPFLAFAYVASIPFFVALYQGVKLLGYARRNQVFSQPAVNALRTIKFCAMTIIGFVVASAVFIPFANPQDDDGPQGVVMRVILIFGSLIVVTAAAVFQRILQNAVDLKSENDLTV